MATSKKDRFKAADPLGEIRRRADEIWREKGCPAGTTAENFIEEAEADLLRGSGQGVPSGRQRTPSGELPVLPALLEIREREQGTLLGAVASSLSALLNSHESFCLAELFLQNRFVVAGAEIELSSAEVASVLAVLAAEYPGVAAPEKLSARERAEYWKHEIDARKAKDAPLGFADRNTMHRLRDTLLRVGFVVEIRPRASVTGPKF